MKIDLYTKCILTVIAVCLGLIVLRDVPILERAEANENRGNVQDVRIVGIHRHPQQQWDAMPTLEQTEFRRPGPQLD
ncbi:MAG: hypothetical protein P8K78_06010 [Pirellulales bacterium]|nr:hypothetical protein [Pirellulales bacterium]